MPRGDCSIPPRPNHPKGIKLSLMTSTINRIRTIQGRMVEGELDIRCNIWLNATEHFGALGGSMATENDTLSFEVLGVAGQILLERTRLLPQSSILPIDEPIRGHRQGLLVTCSVSFDHRFTSLYIPRTYGPFAQIMPSSGALHQGIRHCIYIISHSS
jgi:hypothetical protein